MRGRVTLVNPECDLVLPRVDPRRDVEIAGHAVKATALEDFDAVDEELRGKVCLHPHHHSGRIFGQHNRLAVEGGTSLSRLCPGMTNPFGVSDVEPVDPLRGALELLIKPDPIGLQLFLCVHQAGNPACRRAPWRDRAVPILDPHPPEIRHTRLKRTPSVSDEIALIAHDPARIPSVGFPGPFQAGSRASDLDLIGRLSKAVSGAVQLPGETRIPRIDTDWGDSVFDLQISNGKFCIRLRFGGFRCVGIHQPDDCPYGRESFQIYHW